MAQERKLGGSELRETGNFLEVEQGVMAMFDVYAGVE